MNSTALASVIINNFNYGHFLAQAVESALGQTYSNREVIVVDDGSTDDSREVISRYGNKIIPVLKTNEGQASAFNAGIAASRGKVILFLDADDFLLPTAFEKSVPAFDDFNVAKAHWPMWIVDETGRKTGHLIPNRPLSEGDLRDAIMRGGPMSAVNSPTSGNAWARSFLEKVLPIRECGDKHGADAYLFTLAPIFGRVAQISEPQSCYREHPKSFSGKGPEFRIRRDVRRYEFHCSILSEYLDGMGIKAAPQNWQGPDTVYGWMKGMLALPREISPIIPKGAKFILVDEGQLGAEFFPDWQAIPFTEKDGKYWGPPADDENAIAELNRQRAAGAKYILFTVSCFWWLEHYPGFRHYLSANFRHRSAGENLIVFEL
jgi:glycosyltransferase involved in cell wall biosynthesis